MTRSRRTLGLVVVAGLALVAGACSGDDGGSTPDISLPASLTTTTTAAGPSTTTASPTTTTTVAGANPAGTGAPVIESVTAEPAAGGCREGTIPAVVTVETAPAPAVRVVSVFLDTAQNRVAASPEPGALTIDAVPCDGQVHQIFVIVTGEAAGPDVAPLSSTQAVAFRSPAAS